MATAIGRRPKRQIVHRHTVLAGGAMLVTAAIGVTLLAILLLRGDSPGRAGATTVRASVSDAGSTVRLNTGDGLEVTLEGNPTTGYAWEIIACDASVLKTVGEQAFVADSGALGSGGRVTTSFEAVGAGQTTLKMVYHRTFDKGVPPLKTFELNVTVQ